MAKYGLLTQTFKDFEFILVDELYEKRKDAVEKYFKGSGIDLVQVNATKENHPKWKPWSFTFCRSVNLALAYAKGDLLIVYGDYMLMPPTALEAINTAWETWGKQGLCVPIHPQSRCFHEYKPNFLKYANEMRQRWDWRGGSDNLDAPPDTYISTYKRDFNTDPRVEIWGYDQRFFVSKDAFYGEFRDPSPNDTDFMKTHHIGPAGRFKYWWMPSPGDPFGLIVPVDDAVAVNGWDNVYNGFWGGWGEINARMFYHKPSFNHRYVYTTGCLFHNLPHAVWGIDNPRNQGKSNSDVGNWKRTQEAIARGIYLANNPFNMAEEREKVRKKGFTDIFNY